MSGNHGYRDYWVVKLTKEPNGVNELDNYNLLSIYPNPFTERTLITFDNPNNEEYKMIISDITGKIVMGIDEIYENTVEIHRNNLSAGVYIVELIGRKLFKGKLIATF